MAAASSWKFKVSVGNSFRRDPDTNYIEVPTTQGLKQKIISILRNLPFNGQNVLVQFWAAERIGKTFVLTTTCQPFGLYGNNKELRAYHEACFQHKLYVHENVDPEKIAAFGLPARVFMTCRPEQTRNMHHYPEDHRPPCQDAIFSRMWGSFAVPLIFDKQRAGVLEFVMDKPKDSYDNDIYLVGKALKNPVLQPSIQIERLLQNVDLQPTIQIQHLLQANLKTSIQMEHLKMTYVNGRKRLRRTMSLPCTKYCRLVLYFGLSSRIAAKKLGLKEGTFRNVCRGVGIHEWPYIPNTTKRAASSHGTRINQRSSSETSFFGTRDASEDTFSSLSDFLDSGNRDIPELSPEHRGKLVDLMQEFKDLIDQGNEAPGMEDIHMVDTLFDYNKFDKDQEQRFEPFPC